MTKGIADDRRHLLEPPALLPCPFCGGEARITSDNTGSSWDFRGPHVVCTICGNRTASKTSSYYLEYSPRVWTNTGRLLAARAWNARPATGTMQCPKCGIAVAHTHRQRDKRHEFEIVLT